MHILNWLSEAFLIVDHESEVSCIKFVHPTFIQSAQRLQGFFFHVKCLSAQLEVCSWYFNVCDQYPKHPVDVTHNADKLVFYMSNSDNIEFKFIVYQMMYSLLEH